jgi:putative tRNA adenosine deaminase-associated protein
LGHHVPVPYFTAVIASDGRGWRTRDVDVEDASSLDDLADILRGVGRGDEPVLAVIEHEDEWFALVRVDGNEDARIFVSDLPAASRGVFAELLASAGEVDSSVPTADPEDDEGHHGDDVPDGFEIEDADAVVAEETGLDEEVAVDLSDLETEDPKPPPPWAGHADLLVDLGVAPELMIELCDKHSDDPSIVLAEIGEQAGFAELLDALR